MLTQTSSPVLLYSGWTARPSGAPAQVHRGPHGPVLRVLPVGAASGVRDLADLDQLDELLVLRVDDGDLVPLVGRDQEVALGRVPAAVVEEEIGLDLGDLEVLDVRVVHKPDEAGLLDVDDLLRLEVRTPAPPD